MYGNTSVVGGPAAARGPIPQALAAEFSALLQRLRLPALDQDQAPGVAASRALARVVALAAAWPGLFQKWLRYLPSPSTLERLAAGAGHHSGASRYAGPLGDARLVMDVALAQRAFNVQMMAGEQPVQPGINDLAPLPPEFLVEATGERDGLPSVSGLERKLQNLDQVAYRAALQRAGLTPRPDLRNVERPLVEAGLLKYGLHLWQEMPDAARINVLEITGGGPLPRPWYVYWPEPDATLTELLTRLLVLVQQTLQDAENFWRTYSPEPAQASPLTLGRLPGLSGYRIPAALKQRFRDPRGPGGEMHAQTLVSLALKAKVFRAANYQRGLQQIAARYGDEGLRWLLDGTPSIQVFNEAFAYRNRLIGGQSFARVVSRVPDYFDVLVVPGAPCEAALLNAIAPSLMGQLGPARPGSVVMQRGGDLPLFPGAPPPPGRPSRPGRPGRPSRPGRPGRPNGGNGNGGGPGPGEGVPGGGPGEGVPAAGPGEGVPAAQQQAPTIQQLVQQQQVVKQVAQQAAKQAVEQAQQLQKQAVQLQQAAAQHQQQAAAAQQAAEQAASAGDQATARQAQTAAQQAVQRAQAAQTAAQQAARQSRVRAQQAQRIATQPQAVIQAAAPGTQVPAVRPTLAIQPDRVPSSQAPTQQAVPAVRVQAAAQPVSYVDPTLLTKQAPTGPVTTITTTQPTAQKTATPTVSFVQPSVVDVAQKQKQTVTTTPSSGATLTVADLQRARQLAQASKSGRTLSF